MSDTEIKTPLYVVTDDREFRDPDGSISITLRYIDDDPEGYCVTGLLKTAAFIVKLLRLESARYIIEDIEIINADMGSRTNVIVYNFRAKNFETKY